MLIIIIPKRLTLRLFFLIPHFLFICLSLFCFTWEKALRLPLCLWIIWVIYCFSPGHEGALSRGEYQLPVIKKLLSFCNHVSVYENTDTFKWYLNHPDTFWTVKQSFQVLLCIHINIHTVSRLIRPFSESLESLFLLVECTHEKARGMGMQQIKSSRVWGSSKQQRCRTSEVLNNVFISCYAVCTPPAQHLGLVSLTLVQIEH